MMPQDAGYPEPTSNPPHARPDSRPVAGRVAPRAARAAALAAASTTPAALSAAPDFASLLKALRRRWLTAAVLSVLFGAVAAGATWYLMTPQYTSFVTLKVLSNPQDIIWHTNPAGVAAQSTYVHSQAAAFKSRRIIVRALQQDDVKRLGLDSRYPNVVDWLETDLKTEFVDPGEFMNVMLTALDPTDALTVLKALTNAYMDEVVYAEQTDKSRQLSDVEKTYTDTSARLTRKRENFKTEAEKAGVVVDDNIRDALTRKQKDLLENLEEAKFQRRQLSVDLARDQSQLKALDFRDKAVDKLTIEDSQVERELQTDLIARPKLDRLPALKELVENIQKKTSDASDPILVDAQKRIADLEAAIAVRRGDLKEELKKRLASSGSQESQILRAQLESNIATMGADAAKLDVTIAELKTKAGQIGNWTAELDAQRDEIAGLSTVLNTIGLEKERLNVELKAPPRVSIWQNPDLQKRDAKKQILAAAAAPVGVILLVCMGVAWLDVRQRRVRSAGEVSTGLGIRLFGAVPGVPHLERRLVGPSGEPELEGHPVLDSFDAIRTQLLRDDGAEAARVILVTSAVAGEGKTTLAGHLASSLARAGRKTLLIDGDLRRPSVHQLFEIPMQPGFSEVLLGEVEAADAVQNSAQEGLSILAAGQWDREVMQALARDGLEGIFEKLREEFDFIVVDSHPILPAADSLLIGQHVDAAILSVLRDVSQMPHVYAASQKLGALGIRVLGAVVNGADPDEVFAAGLAPARQRTAG
jgi:succinoglycan biosynthesis transport protein ExoP